MALKPPSALADGLDAILRQHLVGLAPAVADELPHLLQQLPPLPRRLVPAVDHRATNDDNAQSGRTWVSGDQAVAGEARGGDSRVSRARYARARRQQLRQVLAVVQRRDQVNHALTLHSQQHLCRCSHSCRVGGWVAA